MIKFTPRNKFLFCRRAVLPATLILILLTCCNQKTGVGENALADTTAVASSADTAKVSNAEEGDFIDEESGIAALWPKEVIRYSSAANDEVKNALENFSLLTPVLEAAARCVAIRDSLEVIDGNTESPEDSLVFRPLEIKAWQAIQEYKKQIESGTSLKDQCPSLLELTRLTGDGDQTDTYLPEAGNSRYLAHGKFFFLGGAPFIHDIASEDGTPFKDSRGNPEKRYGSSITENGLYMLNSLYHSQNMKAKITFGPPLRSYEMGPQDVNGVGSLIHEFEEPVYVFFLTEDGVVPARLISVEVKLVPESLGCESDQPYYIFGCPKDVEALDILGVYVPYHSEPVTRFKLERLAEGVWTADLNEDGIADLACVSSSFAGGISDTMAEVLWFVNINGTWKILDYAAELDCT